MIKLNNICMCDMYLVFLWFVKGGWLLVFFDWGYNDFVLVFSFVLFILECFLEKGELVILWLISWDCVEVVFLERRFLIELFFLLNLLLVLKY